MPQHSINEENDTIKHIARLLNRTSGALCMKIFNLAHNDPKMIIRGRVGLRNCSSLDKIVVHEFLNDWSACCNKAQNYFDALLMGLEEQGISSKDYIVKEFPAFDKSYATLEQLTCQRFFRNTVLASYDFHCCITGINVNELIVASHIKPWTASADEEKANPDNGLCLNVFHERLFAKGLMTITPDYKIHFSQCLKNYDCPDGFIKNYEGQTIRLPEKFPPNLEYLEYHNDVIFKSAF